MPLRLRRADGPKLLTSSSALERRTFMALVSGGLLAAPLAAEAQTAGKVYRIGILETAPMVLNAANLDAFRQGLREVWLRGGSESFVAGARNHPQANRSLGFCFEIPI